ncbi:MAG TPA: ABC transporter ATP-binding protein [Candidatus Dormibacteraeota bacterium]
MMFWHGWRREVESQSAASGLTGAPELVEPPPEPPKNWRQRWAEVRRAAAGTTAALPRVIQLVWQASPGLTITLFVVTALAGVMPAATAYTSKLLINAVVNAIKIHVQHAPDRAQLDVGFYHSPVLTTLGVIVFVAALQLAIAAVSALLGTIRNIAQQLLQELVQMRIQLMVMEHAAALDLPFFEDPASYDLLRRAQNDSANRPVMMISTAFGLVQTAITFVSMVALLLAVSPLLALLALLSPIPAFISDTRYGWRGFNIARWSSRLLRRMNYLVTLVTTDTYAKEVKLFDLGDFFVSRYRTLSRVYFERQRGLIWSRYLAGFGWGLLTTLAGTATYLYVAVQAVAGKLTLGDLTLYTQAASSVQGSIGGLLGGFSGMYEHNLYLSNLFDLLATKTAVDKPAHPKPLPSPVRGEVVFEHVSFGYPGQEGKALTDVTFRIAPGETIAVVGRNGAGKTTLIKLLTRLYDPTSGRILIDGVDIREYDPDQLRTAVGAMFQDYVTYQATAAENIGLGEVERIEDRPAIAEASRKGGSAPLIEKLPQGLDTALGKWFDFKGANLSGGEWQKVALSRAFMRDARILVLDEPTSALDAQAEYDLFERLGELSKHRTAVYISHRFSTVRRADRILFLEEGRLVEEGTHRELMKLGGRYAKLFRLQAAAYTDDGLTDELATAATR